MDSYEATRIVFSRIQNLDPENASKIMGLLLIQDHGEKEMIRLAFGPEALLHSVILKARKDLGLPSINSPTTPSTPSSSPSPFALSTNPIAISRQSSSSSSRLGIGISIPPSSSASWAAAFSSELQNSDDHLISPGNLPVGSSSSSGNSSVLPFSDMMMDEFQLHDQLSFLNDSSPTLKNSDLFFPPADLSSSPTGGGGFGSYGGDATWGGGPVHRRSCSVNDACLGAEDLNCGLGWKPCLYYARGFCKNGTSCRFLHGDDGAAAVAAVGSPSKIEMMENCHELLRSKSAAQQRLAAASQLMASANSFPYSPKSINFLLQQQQNDTQRAAATAAAALMMGEDLHKFSRSGRNEFSLNGSGGAGIVNPASRQIYLTFPADSTFKEEDVSKYFSNFGPVQDVRIPYQQKRMFGFVTFLYPETVKQILAKGNPHFVCDARVLVKPYKEKGKVPDKKQQQMEREFSACGTPTGLDSRELYDHIQLGSRMFYNSHQDLLWRRKLEEQQQADLQQTLDLQSRRLLNLQLLDVKKNQLHHHHHRALSTGSPIPSPTHSPNPFAQNLIFPTIRSSSNSSSSSDVVLRENGSLLVPQPLPVSIMASTDMPRQPSPVNNLTSVNEFPSIADKERPQIEDNNLLECFEHNLPDSPFASPAKATGNYATNFSDTAAVGEAANNSDDSSSILPSNPSLEVAASFKSYNCQIPRFSSSHSAIGMYAGTGGPTCPVGI
ncbi:zinc finger CCCH domain-containing protein 53-like isoform X2 [Momordica charantia]|uniref:Zinc finger CCCH domain-containing protein 53-like isoform X2 n=1 Tax=Momordica charantia TaxID=3673 RepID=A0A6J1CBI0_MOMCH|nr:zinc finger CCCH domain-containing protein 53-like isoform X2 [Momordica charantia]